MVDLNAAYQDAKYLSDDDLHAELSNPTGMIPGYIVMSELQDRRAIRASGGNASAPQMSMKDELLRGAPQQAPSSTAFRQYSKGGIIAQLNPFNAMVQGMRNPQLNGGLMQDQINAQSGGLPSLSAAQPAGAPSAPPEISSLNPTPPGSPQEVKRYSSGGIASLFRR